MLPFLKENFGNASSNHYFGKSAKVLLEEARDLVAAYTGAHLKEIFLLTAAPKAITLP